MHLIYNKEREVTQEEVKEMFDRFEVVIRNGHFRYASGKHGSDYVDKYAIYPHVRETSRLCRAIAGHFNADDIDIVIGLDKGGIILSHRVAEYLIMMTQREVLGIFAEKYESSSGNRDILFFLREAYSWYVDRKNVLVVEDVINTGNSVKKVVSLIRQHGGNVVGVGALCNRGSARSADVGYVPELFSLIHIPMEAWDAPLCPLCISGVPMNKTLGRG